MAIAPRGKGMYMHLYKKSPEEVVRLAKEAGLSHFLLKITDGSYEYDAGVDKGKYVAALKAAGIQVIGWGYVYLTFPTNEANRIKQMMAKLGLDIFVVDAEGEAKGRNAQAAEFMTVLTTGTTFQIWLSSYRYPWYHPTLPWKEFRNKCDGDMPQVYWLEASNPATQLNNSYKYFQTSMVPPQLPYVPTGCAWSLGPGKWKPTPEQITLFMTTAKSLGMTGVNFWEFNKTLEQPELWQAIADFQWEPEPSPPPPGECDCDDLATRLQTAFTELRNEIAGLKNSYDVMVDDIRGVAGDLAKLSTKVDLIQSMSGYVVSERFKMKDRTPAKFVVGENGVHKLMFQIYPKDTSLTKDRYYLDGTITILPILITGDSGVKVYPVVDPKAPTQVYVPFDAGEIWPTK